MRKGRVMRHRLYGFSVVVAAGMFLSVPAKADLILNAAGIADGFSVTTFASGLPSTGGAFGTGPFGTTVVGHGSGGVHRRRVYRYFFPPFCFFFRLLRKP